MLNRLTVSALIKTVILTTAFCVVIGFSLNAWDSWGRLQVTSRIAVIADASANLFKAMHNLRTDRSTTNRLLNSDQPIDSDIDKYLRNLRDTRNARHEQRARAAALHRIRPATDAGARAGSPVQGADGGAEGILGGHRQAEGLAPPGAGQGIYGDDAGAARHARQTVRQRSPPPSTIRMPRSTNCWRSSRSPGCCATPPARHRS